MESAKKQYVIGTAGHIDHGKTALVQALTGINTDRLREEQERGITIDLGFAHLSDNVTIIDVPGHERLIKNMVAGVSTIDLVLFVVAADDGIMPQTREHLEIVKLLGIRNGIFVITKTDLVEDEWLELVEDDLRQLLKGTAFEEAPILRTSTVKNEGIEEVRRAIGERLTRVPERADDGIFREPIDRVFTKAGFGAVITGSVLSGKIRVGDSVEILPQKLTARVRGIQTHDHPVEEVAAGFRAALNLAGVTHNDLKRGQMITLPGYYQPVLSFNARLQVLPDAPTAIRNQMRLRIHIHTEEVLGRIILPEQNVLQPGQQAFAQFRLEKPIYAGFRDRFIIRQYSPQVTLGGGLVLETNPDRYRKKYHPIFLEVCRSLQAEKPEKRIPGVFPRIHLTPLTMRQIGLRAGVPERELPELIAGLEKERRLFALETGRGKVYFSAGQLERISEVMAAILQDFHRKNPARAGMRLQELGSKLADRFPPEGLPLALRFAVERGTIRQEGDTVSLGGFSARMTPRQAQIKTGLEAVYRDAGFAPPTVKEALESREISEKEFREISELLREEGKLVLVDEGLFFHAGALEEALGRLRRYFRENPHGITVSQFRELLGTTRKYALPLMTYLDNRGYTRREGDVRLPGERLGD